MEEENPEDFQKLLIKVEKMLDRVEQLEDLLKVCYPFVESHYVRSRATLGNNALRIMNEIKKFVDIK
jgi:hypothetical protein